MVGKKSIEVVVVLVIGMVVILLNYNRLLFTRDYISRLKAFHPSRVVPENEVFDPSLNSYGASFIYKGDMKIFDSHKRVFVYYGCRPVFVSNNYNGKCIDGKPMKGELLMNYKYYRLGGGEFFVVGHVEVGF